MLNDLAIPIVGLYLCHVVHAVAAYYDQVCPVLIECTSLKVAIIRVGHLEACKTPLTAKVVVNSFHEVELGFLVLGLAFVQRSTTGLKLWVRQHLLFNFPFIVRKFYTARRVKLHLKDMNCSMIAAACEALTLHIKTNGVDLCLFRSSTHLLQWLSRFCGVYTNDGSLLTCRRQQCPRIVQANG